MLLALDLDIILYNITVFGTQLVQWTDFRL